MVWRGVVIEESLENNDVLRLVKIVDTSEETLEKEDEKGVLHFHKIELDDDKRDEFVRKANSSIKQGWYIHIVNDGTMTVIFRDRTFTFNKYQKDKIDESRDYGVSIGILKEQMDFEVLIDDPYA